MTNYFVLQTPLHVFQALHLFKYLYKSEERFVFFLSKNLDINFCEKELKNLGKCKVIEFQPINSYLITILSSINIRKRQKYGNLYIGNQNSSIISNICTKYMITKIVCFDDGLQYYERGVETKNIYWWMTNKALKNNINSLLQHLRFNILSTRDYLAFNNEIRKKVSVISIFSDLGWKISNPSNVQITPFSNYYCKALQIKINALYFSKYVNCKFLSYQESLEYRNSKNLDVNPRNSTIILHPKFRFIYERHPPFEFLNPSQISAVSKQSSLYYIYKVLEIYNET